jgi:hypothetical protein
MVKRIRNFFGSNGRVCQRSTIVMLCMLIGMLVISISCKKEQQIKQNEVSVQSRQQKIIDIVNFIVITEEERQYLNDPISIDEFIVAAPTWIKMVTVQMDCYFVVSVNDNATVQNVVLSKNTSHVLWYNRLYEYFEIVKKSNEPLISVAFESKDYDKVWNWVVTEVKNGYKVCMDYDKERGTWYAISSREE